jgi:ribosomal protein S19
MTNKVNIEFLKAQLEKALNDVEDLKDKVRANGKECTLMPEMIVALLMLVNGEIKEARIQPSFGKVYGERSYC